MCKLCNTDRLPIKQYSPRRPDFQAIKIVLIEYFNELVCQNCINNLTTKWDREKRTIEVLDRYILKKLFKNHYGVTDKKYPLDTKVVAGIRIIFNPRLHKTTYVAAVGVGKAKNIYLGTYSTFEKALQVKLKYCIQNNHIKSVRNIQNKLKELQNETNIS